jgi:hypothetical protein
LSPPSNLHLELRFEEVPPIEEVWAIFIPRDVNAVEFKDGDGLIGKEVLSGIKLFLNRGRPLWGIVYVAEQTAIIVRNLVNC